MTNSVKTRLFMAIFCLRALLIVNFVWPPTFADRGEYIGCYTDNLQEKSNFPFKPNSANAMISVDKCVDACASSYYMYAALLDAKSCTCGSSYKTAVLAKNDSCSRQCVGNATQYCGGSNANSIYDTGVLVPGPVRNLSSSSSSEFNIHLHWLPPVNINGGITDYKVFAKLLESYDLEPKADQFEWIFPNNTLQQQVGGLIPGTKYNVSVLASSRLHGDGPLVSAVFWTEISKPPEPPQAEILKLEGSNFTIKIPVIHPNGGPLSLYQVIVYDESSLQPINSSKLTNVTTAMERNIPYYITAELTPQEANRPFVVGDGATYRDFFNKPLSEDRPVTVFTRIISSLNNVTKSSLSKAAVYYATFDSTDSDANGFSKSMDSESINDREYVVSRSTERGHPQSTSGAVIGLSVAICIGSILLIASFIIFALMRRYYKNQRQSSDHQELTVHQSPTTETVDNGITSNVLTTNDDSDLMDTYENLKDQYWHFPRPHMNIGDRIIGHGKFGAVRLGVAHRGSQQIPVIVQTTPAKQSLSDRERRNLLNDLNMLVKLGSHNNIVNFVGTCEERDLFHVAVEFYQISMKDFLLDSRALDHYPVYAEKQGRFATIRESQVLGLAIGIACGMAHLAQNKIIHGQLCARNIIILDGTTPKISNFSLSYYDGMKEHFDCLRWTSVETLKSKFLTFKSDVWSFGVVLWEMCTLGSTPYVSVKSKDIAVRVMRGMRLHQPQYILDDLYQLMLQCWQFDLDERPTFSEMINLLQTMHDDSTDTIYLNFDMYPNFEYEKYDAELEMQPTGRD